MREREKYSSLLIDRKWLLTTARLRSKSLETSTEDWPGQTNIESYWNRLDFSFKRLGTIVVLLTSYFEVKEINNETFDLGI